MLSPAHVLNKSEAGNTGCPVQMQTAYDEYNDHARSSGKSRGHFIVDLCRPGHLTICLRNFQERIKCNDDNWDAQFGELKQSNACYLTPALDLPTEINSSVPP